MRCAMDLPVVAELAHSNGLDCCRHLKGCFCDGACGEILRDCYDLCVQINR